MTSHPSDSPVLHEARISGGVWRAVIESATAPVPVVTHLGTPLDGVVLRPDGPGRWRIEVAVPLAALSDGVQSFVVTDTATGARIGSFAVIAGAALDGDLRAEIDLMRAELDLLKRAFRRHCDDTAG